MPNSTHTAPLSLQQAQKEVDQWIKQIGIRYFDPLTNMALLTEEVGELARIVARTYGEQSWKKTERPQSPDEELADVFWIVCCLANQMGVDLTTAFRRNIQKKTQRDALRHKNNTKLR